MKILVDTEERRSPVPAHLAALGVTVDILQLPVGDYLVASAIAVERKSVSDLHRSLACERSKGLAQYVQQRSSDCFAVIRRFSRSEKRPAARSGFEIGITGGTCVACSDRAEPRHLRGSP